MGHADRQRRGAEQELSDVVEQLSDCTLQNQALQTAKRKLDSEMQTLQADLEEMLCESRIAEDKAKKAMIDAARLADELRGEQENAQHCEKNRRSLECQAKDMRTKLSSRLSREAGRSPPGWSRRSRTLSPSSTMSSAVWWRPKSLNAAPLGASRSSHSLRRKTTRTTSGCRSWWTSCRTR